MGGGTRKVKIAKKGSRWYITWGSHDCIPPSPNQHLIERIQVAAASSGQGRQGAVTNELDRHANMVVLGNQCTIIQRKGRYVDVNVFASDVGLMSRVPIVDAALA